MGTRGNLLLHDAGALRAPWRILLFLVLTAACVVVAQAVVAPLLATGAQLVSGVAVSVWGWTMLVALVAAHAAVLRLGGAGESWRTVRLDRRAARPGALLHGFLIGVVAIGLPCLVLLAAGWLRPVPAAPGRSLAAGAQLLVSLAPSAMWEELLVRGYAFAVLRLVAGAPAAVIVTSVAFGLMHLQNAGASLQSVAQVVLAGVWLSGVLLATGSLYAAWAAHLGWNWTMAALLHAPVSGILFAVPDWRLADTGPDWATGGGWGPEGGAFASLGMALTLIYLFARRRRREES